MTMNREKGGRQSVFRQMAEKALCLTLTTVWHKILVGVYFCGLAIFCVLRELIFVIRRDRLFLLGINFCDF